MGATRYRYLSLSLVVLAGLVTEVTAAEPVRRPKARVEVTPELGRLLSLKGGKLLIKGGGELTLLRHFEVEVKAAQIDLTKEIDPKNQPDLLLQIQLGREVAGPTARIRDADLPRYLQQTFLKYRLRIAGTKESYRGNLRGECFGVYGSKDVPGPVEKEASRIKALTELDKRMHHILRRELIGSGKDNEQGLYIKNHYPLAVTGKALLVDAKGPVAFRVAPFEARRFERRFQIVELELGPPAAERK
jgi:hypothetical protein